MDIYGFGSVAHGKINTEFVKKKTWLIMQKVFFGC